MNWKQIKKEKKEKANRNKPTDNLIDTERHIYDPLVNFTNLNLFTF